jgi:hypothetical protein
LIGFCRWEIKNVGRQLLDLIEKITDRLMRAHPKASFAGLELRARGVTDRLLVINAPPMRPFELGRLQPAGVRHPFDPQFIHSYNYIVLSPDKLQATLELFFSLLYLNHAL